MKLLIAGFLFFIFSACTSAENDANTAKQQPTTAESTPDEKQSNKKLIQRVYEDMANQQNYALIDSFFAPDIFDHGALEGQQQGRAGFKKAVTDFLGMFSKVEITVKEIIAEGNMVATRETWSVTMKSNNKVLTGETLHMFRIKGGQITDEWSKGWEWLGL